MVWYWDEWSFRKFIKQAIRLSETSSPWAWVAWNSSHVKVECKLCGCRCFVLSSHPFLGWQWSHCYKPQGASSFCGRASFPACTFVGKLFNFFNYTISTCHLFLPGTLTDKIIMCWISVHLYILTSITYSTTLTALLCCPVLINGIANPSQYLHVRFIHWRVQPNADHGVKVCALAWIYYIWPQLQK